MKRILWTTDIHLNFVDEEDIVRFFERLQAARADALLFSGDIGEANNVIHYLSQLAAAVSSPIYFVLGNHDFYQGSIVDVRSQVKNFCDDHESLHYLTESDFFPLTEQVGLVGHDGWADGRSGDYESSEVMMNDYQLIKELAPYSKLERWPVLQRLGDEAAAHIERVLPLALNQFSHLYLVTHIPPLREACWYNGQISNDEWAPHFTCQAVGETILSIMRQHPDQQLTVLCGHTHSSGSTQPLPNVTILTGAAQYGSPAITELFEMS
ncbi:MAG: metallophosphoesterase [Pirellulaceae bacterium]|jgi:3',5'-cyclic AMP phosphodiesterase CpdA